MKIKLKSILAGPDGVRHPGTIIEVDEKIGQHMLDNGYADLIERPASAKIPNVRIADSKPKIETAVSVKISESEE